MLTTPGDKKPGKRITLVGARTEGGVLAAKTMLDREQRAQRRLTSRLTLQRAESEKAATALRAAIRTQVAKVSVRGAIARTFSLRGSSGGGAIGRGSGDSWSIAAEAAASRPQKQEEKEVVMVEPAWGHWDEAADGPIDAYTPSSADTAAAWGGGHAPLHEQDAGLAQLRSARRRSTQVDELLARSEAELSRRALLLGLFNMFDEDGGGTIDEKEMTRVLERHIGRAALTGQLQRHQQQEQHKRGSAEDAASPTPSARNAAAAADAIATAAAAVAAAAAASGAATQRLHEHFAWLDRDGSGEIDFDEFCAATMGAPPGCALARPTTLDEELRRGAHPIEELLTLLAQMKRARVLKEATQHAEAGRPLETFAELRRLPRLSLFAMEMADARAERDRVERLAQAKAKRRPQVQQKAKAGDCGAAARQPRLPAAAAPLTSKSERARCRMRALLQGQRTVTRCAAAAAPPPSAALPCFYPTITARNAVSALTPLALRSPVRARVATASGVRRRRCKHLLKLGGSVATSFMF